MPGSAPCFCVPPSSGLPGCANAPVPVTHAHAPHFGTPYASWYPLKCESWWVPECESWYPPKFRSAGSAHKAAGRRVVGKTAAFRYPPKYASWYPPKFVSWYPPKCGWARRLAKQPARRRGEVPLPADTPHFTQRSVFHLVLSSQGVPMPPSPWHTMPLLAQRSASCVSQAAFRAGTRRIWRDVLDSGCRRTLSPRIKTTPSTQRIGFKVSKATFALPKTMPLAQRPRFKVPKAPIPHSDLLPLAQ